MAIMNSADMPEDAADDIQKLLADAHADWDSDMLGVETPFSEEAHYEEAPASDSRWQDEWLEFERSLKTEARFMSRSAAAHLERVFSDLDSVRTRSGRPCVRSAGPGTDLRFLHRARVIQSDEPLEEAIRRPDLHLGPPPARHASAGRMNARGISVFYVASAPATALAEVRPPVGSKVVVARFEIVRALRLLDLTDLREAVDGGSVFDPTLSERMARAMFLRPLAIVSPSL